MRYAKDMVADTTNNKIFVLAGSPYTTAGDYLWEFDRTTDKWRVIAFFSATDEAWLITSNDFNIFYIMATTKRNDINVIPNGTYDSSEGTTENPSLVKILKFDLSTGTITTFIDGSNTLPPQLASFYSVGFPRPNATGTRYGKLPDTRAGFTMRGDKLYYRYATATTFGVAEADSDGNTTSFLSPNVAPDSYGNATSFSFCLSPTEMFLAYSNAPTNQSFLSVIKKAFTTGATLTTVFTLNDRRSGEDRYTFTGALEVFVNGTSLYVVAQKHPIDNVAQRVEDNNASGTLYHVSTLGGTPETVKDYDYIQFASRSFTIHNGTTYFFEGSHYTYKFQLRQQRDLDTPVSDPRVMLTANEWGDKVGYLQTVTGTTLTPVGRAWRTALSNPNDSDDSYYGVHGGTASPLVSMGNELYIIPGFGNWDDIGQAYDAPINNVDNVNLLTYGAKIDHRIPRLLSNGKTGYQILQEMASSANAVFGIENNRLFFKSRAPATTNLGTDISNTATTIAAVDTTLFPNAGYLMIGSELISYTSKTATSFRGVKRGVAPSAPAMHEDNSAILGIRHVIYQNAVKPPIRSWQAVDDKENLYNAITVRYDGTTYTITDTDSINRYGRRDYTVDTLYDFTQTHIAAAIGQQYLETFKDLQQRINITMKLSLYLTIGDVILMVTKQGSFVMRIYDLTHELTDSTTYIKARTIIPSEGTSAWDTHTWGSQDWGA